MQLAASQQQLVSLQERTDMDIESLQRENDDLTNRLFAAQRTAQEVWLCAVATISYSFTSHSQCLQADKRAASAEKKLKQYKDTYDCLHKSF